MRPRAVALAALLVGATVAGVAPATADETTSIDEESLPLAADEQQVLTGTTTLPPGTELTVRLRSSNVSRPFLRQQTAYVGEDGTFAAVFDMSPTGANASYDLTVLRNGTELLERTETIAPCPDNCTDAVPERPGRPAGAVSVAQGDVATIPVQMPDEGPVVLSLGGLSVNYLVNASLVDGDADGEVRVRFDTAAAGTDGATLSAADGDDTLTITDAEPNLSSTIDPASYEYRVFHGGDTGGAPDAGGTLPIEANARAGGDYGVSDHAGRALPGSVVTTRQGETAAINVTLADAATVSLGGPETGYQINATVSDGDGDGRVTLLFDTAAAGRSGTTLTTADPADTVTVVSGSEVDRDTYIDAASYDLRLYRGDDVDGQAVDIGVVDLRSGNVSSPTETAPSVDTGAATGTGGTGPVTAGIGALAVGGTLAIGAAALVFRSVLS